MPRPGSPLRLPGRPGTLSGHHTIRDSKNPTGPALLITPTQWTTFTTALRTGDFI